MGAADAPATMPVFVVAVSGSIFMPLNGFLDCLVYGAVSKNNTIGPMIMHMCKCRCGRSKKGYRAINTDREDSENILSDD